MPLLLVPRHPTAREVAAHLLRFNAGWCVAARRCARSRHPVTAYYRGEAQVLAHPPFAVLEPMPGAPSAYRLTPSAGGRRALPRQRGAAGAPASVGLAIPF